MGNLRYTNLPSETPEEDALAELALDVSAHWSRFTDPLWRQLNPDLWERTGNPWLVLQTVSSEKLKAVTSRPEFRSLLGELLQARAEDARAQRWFQRTYGNSALKTVAYFSMEYMLTEGLPIYSGGLGNVAGDQLKAADDLGVPVIGIGLLYSQGYFRQVVDRNGDQRALFPYNDPGQLPIRPLRKADGDWLRLSMAFPGCELWVRAWEAQVGPGQAISFGHQRSGELSRVSHRHQRTVRRRTRTSYPAGDGARNRRLAPAAGPGDSTRGVSSE